MFPFVFSGPPSSRPSHCPFPPNILTSIRWGGGQGQQQQSHQLSLSASSTSLRRAFLLEHFSGLIVTSLLSDMILGKTELNEICLCISLIKFPCYGEHSLNCLVLTMSKDNFVKYYNWWKPSNSVSDSNNRAVWLANALWSFIRVHLTILMLWPSAKKRPSTME